MSCEATGGNVGLCRDGAGRSMQPSALALLGIYGGSPRSGAASVDESLRWTAARLAASAEESVVVLVCPYASSGVLRRAKYTSVWRRSAIQ